MTGAPKYLIVGPSWVGDMVMAQSLYRLLLQREPQATIHVVAPPWSLPILERMDQVARGIELPVAHGETAFAKRYAIGKSLRSEGYTHAIILPRSLKSALVPFFARVPVRTGFRGEWRYGLINDMRPFDRERLDQTVKRFVELGRAADEVDDRPTFEFPRLRVDAKAQAQTLQRLGISGSEDVVALLPGAEYGPAKQWPLPSYADLARRLARVGIAVWVLGSEKERDLGQSIADLAGHGAVRNLCGETRLGEVVDVLGAVRVAVTNDSGLLHVAAAVGVNVVAIYGSSSPKMTPPLTNKKHIFHLDLECSPCFERECPLEHLRCLRDIGVDEVCSTVITALGQPHAAQQSGANG
ncbi:MAG: lipopolysaccharide heptosyltransferase II [Gammaproteobacteria bacterium]|nr:lipopolysaccharide heptosyltransferase II [Gammaproteobacteria bacterium]